MVNVLSEGDKAPAFRLAGDGGSTIALKDYAGKTLVLYFYPKDDTTACTKQAQGFSDEVEAFAKAGVAIVGLSKDTAASHDKFKKKYDLKFALAADPEGKTLEDYGVWQEKSMYGRKYMGIERSTFLINAKGKIAKIWRKVKVPGHVAEVLEAAKAL